MVGQNGSRMHRDELDQVMGYYHIIAIQVGFCVISP